MKTFCLNAVEKLKNTNDFGKDFVDLKMEFFRKFQNPLICSIIHGPDFFSNVLECMGGKKWKEEDVYGDNFRQLVKKGLDIL